MDSRRAPKGWFDYSPIGKQIEGTRFIAFKVPLKKEFTEDSETSFTVDHILEKIPNLGLVIDLTFTEKYYNPKDFGVDYIKIFVPGHTLPSPDLRLRFNDAVKKFMAKNEKNDKLIGVHCTHGVNRTGFFICNQMITVHGIDGSEAMKRFAEGRGHKIERANYTEFLRNSAGKSLTKYADDVKSSQKQESYTTSNNHSRSYEYTRTTKQRDEPLSWSSSFYRNQEEYPARTRTFRSPDRNTDDKYLSWRGRHQNHINNEQSSNSRRVLRSYEKDRSQRYCSNFKRNSIYHPISSTKESGSKHAKK